MKKFLANLVGMTAATVITILLVDAIAFWLLPAQYVQQFPHYRRSQLPEGIAGRGAYPHDYFVANEERGFDIGRNRRAEHWVEGNVYPIWSNSLGCLDNEPDVSRPYVYLVGDSYTWGYAPFEDKFGAHLEQDLSIPVMKCGVTHSGQRHQLLKLLEIERETASTPQLMLTFWYLNDIANDHYFPHSTVVDGWQLDMVSVEPDGSATRIPRAVLAER
ncbi:MAG: hypothetical protein R3E84_14495 [Pseudomonadales bacterium]